jgi:acid phosphatase family membrane protein YuiD
MFAFWENVPLVGALAAMLAAQLFKFLYHLVRTGRFDAELIWNAGGMPSSHTAMACALAAALAFQDGVRGFPFAIATVLALIVMYDAAGIRQQAGRQAVVIKQLVRELHRLDSLPPGIDESGLKELLGHRPLEVFVGALVGVLSAAVVTGMLSRVLAAAISFAAVAVLFLGAARRLVNTDRGRK